MQPIHKHLLVFAKVNKFPNEKEEKVVTDFMEKLVEKIDMKLIAGPIAKYVSDQGNIGWTSALLLSTSHAAMHIWNEWGTMQLDVYSCKEFDERLVIAFLKETFDATIIKHRIINRDGGLNDEEGLKITEFK
tara:strand:- start:1744 stop:2139 length:396 start_codon:yes stop_codon:yes gene_type:complete